MLSGEGMDLIEEWRVRDGFILVSKNSFFGIWCLVYFPLKPGKDRAHGASYEVRI